MMGYRPTDPVFFEWTNPQGATNGVRTFEESFDTAPPRAAGELSFVFILCRNCDELSYVLHTVFVRINYYVFSFVPWI